MNKEIKMHMKALAYAGINMFGSGLPNWRSYLITKIPALEIDLLIK